MEHRGLLVVISGFSGAGKGTIVHRLMERYPGEYALSISMTTRAPRPGESEGREYFFTTDERFTEAIAAGELIEHAGYCGHYYGTPRAYVEQRLGEGTNVILEIEYQGMRQAREMYPDLVSVFVSPPSIAVLKKRLTARGTEDAGTIQKRLLQAVTEGSAMSDYEYIVVNDDIETAVDEVHGIIKAARSCTSRAAKFVQEIQAELEGIV